MTKVKITINPRWLHHTEHFDMTCNLLCIKSEYFTCNRYHVQISGLYYKKEQKFHVLERQKGKLPPKIEHHSKEGFKRIKIRRTSIFFSILSTWTVWFILKVLIQINFDNFSINLCEKWENTPNNLIHGVKKTDSNQYSIGIILFKKPLF